MAETLLTPGTEPPSGWQIQKLPTPAANRHIQALWRAANRVPAVYRLLVIPGSGCAGLGPLAQAYFAGLEAGEVWIFHKPYSRPWVASSSDACSDDFLRDDSLARWQADVLHAFKVWLQQNPDLPVLLMGISEGAEVLAPLAAQGAAQVTGLVLLSASGLDPAEAFQMQLQQMGRAELWAELKTRTRSQEPDAQRVQGRSLRYWRDLFGWSSAEALLNQGHVALQIWGDADELIPAAAYRRFVARSQGRALRLCSWRLPGANHALRSPGGIQAQQKLWPLLDSWAIQGRLDCPAAAAAVAP